MRGRERGAAAVEYAVLLSLIIMAIILAISILGSSTKAGFECAGQAYGGTTCVEGTKIDNGDHGHECTSQNGEHGNGCFDKK
jgi:Flp pilus assembly pilin Flp